MAIYSQLQTNGGFWEKQRGGRTTTIGAHTGRAATDQSTNPHRTLALHISPDEAGIDRETLPDTPSKVIAAFERVMTETLGSRFDGKASAGDFAPAWTSASIAADARGPFRNTAPEA